MVARVTLRINPLSPSWLLNASWPGRVGDWLDSFQGKGWQPTCSPQLSPAHAVVYLRPVTGASLTERQIPALQENWSDRVGGVSVQAIEIRDSCDDPARDRDSINRGLLDSTIDAVGRLFGEAGKALAVPLTLAILGTGIFLAVRYTRKGE